ncbi:MAG UNVERIFIED_CONTAM: hypothetical protein LVR18_51310, partial [Planctomycetaceae bacterium]
MINMRNPFSGLLPDLGSMKWFSLKASIPEINFLPFLDINIPDLNLSLPSLSLNLTFDVPTLSIPTPYIDFNLSMPSIDLPGF